MPLWNLGCIGYYEVYHQWSTTKGHPDSTASHQKKWCSLKTSISGQYTESETVPAQDCCKVDIQYRLLSNDHSSLAKNYYSTEKSLSWNTIFST